jgi:hypothetical protein
VLLTFFDFPAERWKHLRTSNVIESPFATVRLRQRVTKAGRTKGLGWPTSSSTWRRIGGVASTARISAARPSRRRLRGRRPTGREGQQAEDEGGVILPDPARRLAAYAGLSRSFAEILSSLLTPGRITWTRREYPACD